MHLELQFRYVFTAQPRTYFNIHENAKKSYICLVYNRNLGKNNSSEDHTPTMHEHEVNLLRRAKCNSSEIQFFFL